MSHFDATEAEAEAARAHFDKCGPFCKHVEFCPECRDAYGVCDRHSTGVGSMRFKRPGQTSRNRTA